MHVCHSHDNVWHRYRFLAQLLANGLKFLGLVLHLLTLLVVVDGQLLQSLQHLLNLLLGGLVLCLEAVQLSLQVLVIAAGGGEELQTESRSLTSTPLAPQQLLDACIIIWTCLKRCFVLMSC